MRDAINAFNQNDTQSYFIAESIIKNKAIIANLTTLNTQKANKIQELKVILESSYSTINSLNNEIKNKSLLLATLKNEIKALKIHQENKQQTLDTLIRHNSKAELGINIKQNHNAILLLYFHFENCLLKQLNFKNQLFKLLEMIIIHNIQSLKSTRLKNILANKQSDFLKALAAIQKLLKQHEKERLILNNTLYKIKGKIHLLQNKISLIDMQKKQVLLTMDKL